MKWTIFAVAGLAAAAAAFIVGGTAAQKPLASTPLPAATKVGLVNIGTLFTPFRTSRIDDGLGREAKAFRDEREKLEKKLEKLISDWRNALANPNSKLTDAQTEQGARTITDCKRRLCEFGSEYRLVQLYKQINDAIGSYAKTQGYHLILGYGEPMDGDLLSAMNVARKMDAMKQGDYVPIYFADELDVSRQVLELLNRSTASPTPTPRQPAVTKVGVVNMAHLFGNYYKSRRQEEERKKLGLRRLEDKQDVPITQLFQEITDAVRSSAVAQGYHLILGHAGPINGEQLLDKYVTGDADTMKHGGVVPTFFSGALDISPEVLENLNQNAPSP